MRRRHTGVFVVLAFIVVVAAAGFAVVWRPAIPLETAPRSFPAAQTAKGAQLAAIGNCITCHTAASGAFFAGGRPIPTPFGTVYSINITPDRDTGIGGWSEAAFRRAMRDGVSRDGHHLYPAFPYDHMTLMSDADIDAVYAFMMTRQPIHAAAQPNNLRPPYDHRALVAGWKFLFLRHDAPPEDTSKGADWNRGAYLVEGLGHCGACHTPRNSLGAERRNEAYAGGESDGWIAPALNAASPAAVPWDANRLYAYLRTGFDPMHGIAAGPMAPVVRNLEAAPDADVRAIAVYVADIARRTPAEPHPVAGKTPGPVATDSPGAMVYAGACAQCHGEFGRKPSHPALSLKLSSALPMPQPDNAIRIVRGGIHPAEGAGPIMPGFANVLTDEQLGDLLGFLRSGFAERPQWPNISASIRSAKRAATLEARSAQ